VILRIKYTERRENEFNVYADAKGVQRVVSFGVDINALDGDGFLTGIERAGGGEGLWGCAHAFA
jgi:hypothetical protein